ncbi:hypothetical protein DOTSEDRAFT_75194, partial [Dothistroma septosporum NZE10]
MFCVKNTWPCFCGGSSSRALTPSWTLIAQYCLRITGNVLAGLCLNIATRDDEFSKASRSVLTRDQPTMSFHIGPSSSLRALVLSRS